MFRTEKDWDELIKKNNSWTLWPWEGSIHRRWCITFVYHVHLMFLMCLKVYFPTHLFFILTYDVSRNCHDMSESRCGYKAKTSVRHFDFYFLPFLKKTSLTNRNLHLKSFLTSDGSLKSENHLLIFIFF